MDPITRIAKDTGVPREVIVKVVTNTVAEHRVVINDDEPEATEQGELISLSEAERRFGTPTSTLFNWIREGRLTDHGGNKRRGSPRLVDANEVSRLAAEPRRRGPRKPKQPAYLDPGFAGSR